MSLKIRLARGGAKKRPMYRIVVADSRAPRDGAFLERVGVYQPLLAKDNPDRLTMNVDRIKFWLSRGATPTDRVAVFLGKAEVIPMPVRSRGAGKQKAREAEAAAKAEAEAVAKAEAEAAEAAKAAEAAEAARVAEAAAAAEGTEGNAEETAS